MRKEFNNEKGQAALIMVLIIMSILTVLIASLGFVTYNSLKSAGNVVSSSQSYYVAEAGSEDALLRIMNRMSYPSSYTLAVGSSSTQVNISGPLVALVITSQANVNNRSRKVEVDLGTSQSTTNIGFNYGVQVGYGGLVLDNNAGVNGNVYSNGPISGSNGSFVNGTAVSATGVGSIDQDNSAPANPPNSIIFGNATGTQDAAQSFQVSATNQINSVSLYLKKIGNPGNLTVRITNDNSGKPGTTTYASTTLIASSVTGSYGWVNLPLGSNPQLTLGTTYWIVLDGSTSSSNYYNWGANSAYASGEAKTGPYSAGPWNTTGLDGYFKVLMGGVPNSINRVVIGSGSTGDAWANTVTNSTIAGNNYCQIGSGNNKVCNTSRGNPPSQAFPITQANINEWKSEASAGGVISGNYSLTNGGSLGPKQITGDLTVSGTVTITGTVWVQGNVSLSNNTTVNLDPGYGANGGVIVSDGWANMSNNTKFNGSGQASSYFLFLTTSDCPTSPACNGSYAMDISNNVGAVIVYTTNGTLHLNNNAAANQATGYKILLDNNATVTYLTGLANAVFSSGPGAGFKISSWREIT